MGREAIHTLAAVAIAVVAVGLVAMVPSATGYTGHIHDAEAERLTGRARVEAMYGSDVASGAAFEISTCDLELRSAKDLTPQQFEAEYGAAGKPVIITDALEEWDAMELWTLDSLETTFGGRSISVEGQPMQMYAYVDYMRNNGDYDPAYVFEEDFLGANPDFHDHYEVPEWFADDFLEDLPENNRPLYKWWLLGPQRTGSAFHLDPYNTSAWNALVVGRKRWALYPPSDFAPPGYYGHDSGATMMMCADYNCRSPSAIDWFRFTYPHLADTARPMECVQEAGSVIFVPSGWWHAVLNLDHTVAVTQNFVTNHNAREVLSQMRREARMDPSDGDLAAQTVRTWAATRPSVVSEDDLAWERDWTARRRGRRGRDEL